MKSFNGANNTEGLGATVIVTAGENTYTQVVDGGSGFASQHEADLIFGLGNYYGGVSGTVTWPNGHVQVLLNIETRQYTTVVDDCPVIDNDSVDFQMVYHLDTGMVDWVFTWVTSGISMSALDNISLDLSGVPERCQPGISELHEGVDNVTVQIDQVGEGQFQHTLTFADLSCEGGCYIPFIAESAVEDFTSTSSSQLIKIRACLVTP